ncbi:hypothetical protein DRO57_07800 [Candidatus Bathyarchaeota archaeon]|nr:MAG: hypothetical protein DRO57_07800 [Candidatus Bathyarchaeota archaeon]
MVTEFYEAVFKRRSVRCFREKPVPEEALNRILEATRWAFRREHSALALRSRHRSRCKTGNR